MTSLSQTVLPDFSERSALINASLIRKVFDLAAQKKNPINLSIGQPDFPVPELIKEALKEAIDQNLTSYTQTQGILALRERITKKFSEENGLRNWDGDELSADNILVSPGVSALLFLLFSVLLNPGDEIILVDPYFLMYEGLANYFQVKTRYIREDHLVEDLEKVASDKIKFILFSSPSNPTGKIIPAETLKEMAAILDKYGILAIADEIYEKFDFDGTHASLGAIYPKTITLNGFSKSYALTGLRLGYLAAPKAIVDKMATIQQYTFVCAPYPTQYAGLKAFDVDLSAHITDYRKRRDLIYNLLKDHFEVSKPEGAFYIFPWLKSEHRDAIAFAEKAVESNVLIVPGNIFTQRAGGFRISFATSEESLQQGAEILIELQKKF